MGQNISQSTSSSQGDSTDMTQQEIIFVVNNIGPSIQQLGRQLQLTKTQQTELEQSKESLHEKAQKMLDWWTQRQGKSATKDVMVEALRQIERNDMADDLCNSATLAIDHQKLTDFAKLQQRLMQRYSHYRIPQPPNIKNILSIDDVFIHQEMEMNDKFSKKNPENVQLKDLFQPFNKNPVTRILIEGDPGFGKTTLAFKLAQDWANGEEYIASQFHLVMLIPLREVKDKKLEDVILGIIQRAVNKTSITTKDLKSYLFKHRVLLLLDGYDEMTIESRCYLKEILEKEELETACILVTSRRGIFCNEERFELSMSLVLFEKEDNSRRELWDKKIQLKGLTTEQRKQLLSENFEIKPHAMKSIEELFSGNSDEMFRCPLLVFWLGWLSQKQPIEQFKTKTDFYKAMINLILHKTMVEERKIKFTDPLDIFAPTEDSEILTLRKQVQQFGKIALERLIHQNFSFTEDDLKELSGSTLIVSDLLVKYKSITHEKQEIHYQTIHKSFLEFLAALSVSYCVETENMRFDDILTIKMTISNMVNQGLGPCLDSLFFPFLAGLMGQRAHWLFDSLSPWSAIYKVRQPEMVNILSEMTNVTDEIMESLMKFIPSNYTIHGFGRPYYSSDCHTKIFQKAVERELITVLEWDLAVLNPLPVESLTVDRILLIPSCIPMLNISTATTIHCNELICYIDRDVTPTLWDSYLTVYLSINAIQHHLCITGINILTFTMIFNEIQNGQWNHLTFQRVRLDNILLDDIHLEVIIQLLIADRIKKGLYLQLNKDHTVTGCPLIMEIWEAVMQLPTIDEFHFSYSDWKFNPVFNFSLVSDVIRQNSFQMMSLNGNFSVTKTESICCMKSIQELIMYNLSCPDAVVIDLLKNFDNVKYLECSNHLFLYCVLSNLSLATTLTELHLVVLRDVSLISSASVMNQLVSLRALTLNILCFSSEFIPQPVDNFLVAMLSSKKLQFLGFHLISSPHVLVGLTNTMLKIKERFNLFCLELKFYDEGFELFPSAFSAVKALLMQKQVNHVAIVDLHSTTIGRCVLPLVFSEEEFQFKHEINGYESKHFIRNQQWYERLLVTSDRFLIELKH